MWKYVLVTLEGSRGLLACACLRTCSACLLACCVSSISEPEPVHFGLWYRGKTRMGVSRGGTREQQGGQRYGYPHRRWGQGDAADKNGVMGQKCRENVVMLHDTIMRVNHLPLQTALVSDGQTGTVPPKLPCNSPAALHTRPCIHLVSLSTHSKLYESLESPAHASVKCHKTGGSQLTWREDRIGTKAKGRHDSLLHVRAVTSYAYSITNSRGQATHRCGGLDGSYHAWYREMG